MSLRTEVRINFKDYKDNINFYKDKTSFIFFREVKNRICSYGFVNNNKNINMGVLVPNISDLFGLEPNHKYIRIIDKKGITIKLKNQIKSNKNNILIINPNNKIYYGKVN